MSKMKAFVPVIAGVTLFSVVGTAFAAQHDMSGHGMGMGAGRGDGKMVMGKITAIQDMSITLTSGPEGNTKTVTVDAKNASFAKMTDAMGCKKMGGGATTTQAFSDLAVGESIAAHGEQSNGIFIAAQVVEMTEDMASKKEMKCGGMGHGGRGVVGTVQSLSGTSFTLESQDGTKYTVDASSATIKQDGDTNATISDIAVGDKVAVHGTISDANIAAMTIIDNVSEGMGDGANMKCSGCGNGAMMQDASTTGSFSGFFKNIKGFFSRLFGGQSASDSMTH